MSRPPFDGSYSEITGWSYSSGAGHYAYDYTTPLGTHLFAINEGVILNKYDGVKNNPPGYNPGAGAPSNWILLGTWLNGEKVTAYYQHLSPGLEVYVGEKVVEGEYLGRSGNSGNTTGPHLHLAAMHGWVLDRYAYMQNNGINKYLIYPPSKLWTSSEEDVLDKDDKDWIKETIHDIVWRHQVATDGKNEISFSQAVNRWSQYRSGPDIAKLSAKATVRALKEGHLLKADVDEDAVARAVALIMTEETD